MRPPYRNPAQRLRSTVERLPDRTKRAMLKGIARNRIIVGAYSDPRSGGICPMLAAHRNGGRTDLASFAIAWDAFTGAKRPRLATRREVRTLRTYLEMSLLADEQRGESISKLAGKIRAERAEVAARAAEEHSDEARPRPLDATIEPAEISIRRAAPQRRSELRDRVRSAWMRPSRRLGEFPDVLDMAELHVREVQPDGSEPAPRP
jgi:hypothetical protein